MYRISPITFCLYIIIGLAVGIFYCLAGAFPKRVESTQTLTSSAENGISYFSINPSPTGERPLKKISHFLTAIRSFAEHNTPVISITPVGECVMIDGEPAYTAVIVVHGPLLDAVRGTIQPPQIKPGPTL